MRGEPITEPHRADREDGDGKQRLVNYSTGKREDPSPRPDAKYTMTATPNPTPRHSANGATEAANEARGGRRRTPRSQRGGHGGKADSEEVAGSSEFDVRGSKWILSPRTLNIELRSYFTVTLFARLRGLSGS